MTSTSALIDELANAVASRVASHIPIDVDLWSAREIASYLKVSETHVHARLTGLPGFPRAIRLPTTGNKGSGHPRWKAAAVIEWANKHQEK